MQPIRIRTRFLVRTLCVGAPLAVALAAALPLASAHDEDDFEQKIAGDAGDNVLVGGDERDEIFGYDGNDTLDGKDGHDHLDGGDGDDTIMGGDDGDWIMGRDGNDTIEGNDGDDEIYAGFGNDTVEGGEGNDIIDGGQHNDIINGGGGNDTITSGEGGGVVHGHAGDDVLTSGQSWPQPHFGYPRWNEDGFNFQTVLSQVYGDDGNDYIKSAPTASWGASFHYLHGGTGSDVIEGAACQDLIIVQGGDDTIITGGYEDYVAIIGNSVEGYTFYDTLHYLPSGDVEKDENGNPVDYNNGTDMICFIRDVNPDQLTMITVNFSGGHKHFMEFDTGLPTRDPVNLDLNDHPMLKNFEAFRTGDAADTLVGRDYGTPEGPDVVPSYVNRLRGEQDGETPWSNDPDSYSWLNLHELFFTGAGNDTITTNRGNDFVDAGSGNDTIHVGPDNCFIITGPGSDTVHFAATSLDGTDSDQPDGGKTRIADLGRGDSVVLAGVASNQVTLEEATMPDNKGGALLGSTFTRVLVDGTEQFVIMFLTPGDLVVTNGQGRNAEARITLRPDADDPRTPVGPVFEGSNDREPAGGGRDGLPTLPGGGRDRGGR